MPARFALGLPFLNKLGEARDVFAVLRAGTLRDFQPLEKIGEYFSRSAAAQRFAMLRQELSEPAQGSVRRIKGKLSLRSLQHVVERFLFFAGTLGKADEIRWLK